MTPAALSAALKTKYAPVLARADVTVIVKTSSGKKIFVDGEVGSPGVKDVTGPLTIRQCIAQAGGLKDTARGKEILVIRRRPDKDPIVVAVNMETVNSGEDFTQDITVRPNDIVYVPKSPIAEVNLWVRQYITQMLPFPVFPAATW